MDKVKLSIYSIIGNTFCVAAEDGEKVFKQIKEALKKNKTVEVSFLNIEMLTSAFLNTAVGKLYGEFDEQKIKASLSVIDINKEDKALLKRVNDTAKLYYNDPDKMDKSIREILAD